MERAGNCRFVLRDGKLKAMRASMKIPGFRYVGTTNEPAFVTEDGRVRIRQVTPRKWVVQPGGVGGFEVAGRDAAVREARRLASEVAVEDVRVLKAGKKLLSHHHATKKSPAQLDSEIAEALSRTSVSSKALKKPHALLVTARESIEIPIDELEATMERLGFQLVGYNENLRQRAELQGAPKFRGVAGPMWDGEKTPWRYETTQAYRVLSR